MSRRTPSKKKLLLCFFPICAVATEREREKCGPTGMGGFYGWPDTRVTRRVEQNGIARLLSVCVWGGSQSGTRLWIWVHVGNRAVCFPAAVSGSGTAANTPNPSVYRKRPEFESRAVAMISFRSLSATRLYVASPLGLDSTCEL